jgi:hypothetical protein
MSNTGPMTLDDNDGAARAGRAFRGKAGVGRQTRPGADAIVIVAPEQMSQALCSQPRSSGTLAMCELLCGYWTAEWARSMMNSNSAIPVEDQRSSPSASARSGGLTLATGPSPISPVWRQ